MWGREEQQTLTDIRVVLLSGLIGAVLSAVVALFIAQRQQAKQRRQEKWVRVLNGYQDFYTEGQKYLTFLALDQQELARDALKAVYKAAYDVGLLDPLVVSVLTVCSRRQGPCQLVPTAVHTRPATGSSV